MKNENRKIGSGRPKGSKNKQHKYILEIDSVKYPCKTVSEMSNIAGKSRMCITRIMLGYNTYKKKSSHELKEIKIYKIDNNKK